MNYLVGHLTKPLTASGIYTVLYLDIVAINSNMLLLVTHYYRSLRSSNEGGLTLEELQVGMCALDPATPHGSVSGQLRCQFIFRYYNISGKGFMSFQEFRYLYMYPPFCICRYREMVRDICIFKNQLNEETFEKTLIDNWK